MISLAKLNVLCYKLMATVAPVPHYSIVDLSQNNSHSCSCSVTMAVILRLDCMSLIGC